MEELEDLASEDEDEDSTEPEASEAAQSQKGPSRRMTPGRGFGPRRTRMTSDDVRKEMLDTYGAPELHE